MVHRKLTRLLKRPSNHLATLSRFVKVFDAQAEPPAMTPSVAERLGLRPSVAPPPAGEPDRALMARSLMCLFLAGAAITLAALFLDDGGADRRQMAIMALSALTISAVLFFGYANLPGFVFPLFLACGSLLIEWTIYASGESASPYAMFWFWLAIYAFYFLSRGQALIQLGVIVLAYAAVLSQSPDPTTDTAVRWTVTTGALIVAGALIGLLKERLDRVIAQLEDVSRADRETGLLNRRAFDETLGRSLELARRTQGRLALAVGQPADGVSMAAVGAALAGAVRATDVAARIGERTVAVISPGTGDHGGYVLAEQLQRALEDADVCFGVAAFPQHGARTPELVAAAQGALVEARALGPGRVVTAGAEHAAVA